jgi:hypothetical protein
VFSWLAYYFWFAYYRFLLCGFHEAYKKKTCQLLQAILRDRSIIKIKKGKRKKKER